MPKTRRFPVATRYVCGQWPLVGLGLLLLAACAAPAPAPPVTLPPVSAEQLVQRLEQNGQDLHSLRGLAKVRLTAGDRTVSLTQVLLAETPNRLRTESLSPFGSPLMILTSDGETLNVLLPGDRRFLSGRASAENLRRFTRLPLRPADLVGLLLYQPPRFSWQHARVETVNGSGYRLELTGAGTRRQLFTFDPRQRLVEASYYDGEKLLLEVRYTDLENRPELFPTAAELVMPGYDIQATLRFEDDVALNADLDPGDFHLEPPEGVVVEALGAGR